MVNSQPDRPNVVLITGAAHRIGATIAKQLHHKGYNIAIHYRNSEDAAQRLAMQLNNARHHSAVCICADLNNPDEVQQLSLDAKNAWGQINALVNNASTFYPTPLQKLPSYHPQHTQKTKHQTLEDDWDALMNSNLRGPFFLSHALAPALKDNQGCIINIVDIYAERPLLNYSIYSIAKAGVAMMTKSLAKEFAPHIRVNGVSPGAILWPEQSMSTEEKKSILEKIPLQETGKASDIARTVLFLLQDAPYINGQIIAVDGGRTLNI